MRSPLAIEIDRDIGRDSPRRRGWPQRLELRFVSPAQRFRLGRASAEARTRSHIERVLDQHAVDDAHPVVHAVAGDGVSAVTPRRRADHHRRACRLPSRVGGVGPQRRPGADPSVHEDRASRAFHVRAGRAHHPRGRSPGRGNRRDGAASTRFSTHPTLTRVRPVRDSCRPHRSSPRAMPQSSPCDGWKSAPAPANAPPIRPGVGGYGRWPVAGCSRAVVVREGAPHSTADGP